MDAKNIFADLPESLAEELTETIHQSDNVRIERIVSRGHCSAEGSWYDQDTSEWVVLLAGRAKLEFEGAQGPIELQAGDYLNIPAHTRHRVVWTDPDAGTVWLAIHY